MRGARLIFLLGPDRGPMIPLVKERRSHEQLWKMGIVMTMFFELSYFSQVVYELWDWLGRCE